MTSNNNNHSFPPLPSKKDFLQRFARNISIGFLVIIFSLGIGMLGYRYIEKTSWADAYVNAAMILSGVGATEPIKTEAGKIFFGTYALFSGIVFLFIIAIIFAPILRRFLHRFHLERKE